MRLAGKSSSESYRQRMDTVYPFLFISFRWPIEVCFYEQKTFWSLCSYMLRSKTGIELLVTLINISYCSMKIIPFQENDFNFYCFKSVQDFRFFLNEKSSAKYFYPISLKISKSVLIPVILLIPLNPLFLKLLPDSFLVNWCYNIKKMFLIIKRCVIIFLAMIKMYYTNLK